MHTRIKSEIHIPVDRHIGGKKTQIKHSIVLIFYTVLPVHRYFALQLQPSTKFPDLHYCVSRVVDRHYTNNTIMSFILWARYNIHTQSMNQSSSTPHRTNNRRLGPWWTHKNSTINPIHEQSTLSLLGHKIIQWVDPLFFVFVHGKSWCDKVTLR